MSAYVFTFADAASFVAAATKAPRSAKGRAWLAAREESMAAYADRGDNWYGDGAVSLAAVAAMASRGVARDFVAPAMAAATAVRTDGPATRMRNAVAGGSVSVPRFLDGRPDCMRRRVRTVAPSETVVVRMSIASNGDVSADSKERRGLAVLEAVSALSRSGRKVEVWATYLGSHYGAGGRSATQIDVCVKRADALLDWQRVAFFACHPAALRGLRFAHTCANVGPGYDAPEPGQFCSESIVSAAALPCGAASVTIDTPKSSFDAAAVTCAKILSSISTAKGGSK